MIILDGIIAGVIMHYFGGEMAHNLLSCLGLTCMVTFLRMSLKVGRLIDDIDYALTSVYGIENKEEI